MARLSDRDVQDILDLLENEVDTLSRMSSVERMKMRSKIRRQSTWLLEWNDPSAENILQKLQWRLADLFIVYPHGFCDNLLRLLENKMRQLNFAKKKTVS
jgi:hypothetical protein